MQSKSIEDHIRNYDLDPSTGCWLWRGGTNSSGYGQFCKDGKNYRIHRCSYEFYNGVDPGDYFVCHSCDIRKCFNPDHLFLGTHTMNMVDAAQKGRLGKQRGEKHAQAKLSDEDVRAIRKDTGSLPEIGRRYSVHHVTILRIKQGKTWKHVI